MSARIITSLDNPANNEVVEIPPWLVRQQKAAHAALAVIDTFNTVGKANAKWRPRTPKISAQAKLNALVVELQNKRLHRIIEKAKFNYAELFNTLMEEKPNE